MYEPPGDDVSFGDIFEAAWFFDAYLRRDAVPLVQFTSKSGPAWRAAVASHHRDALFAHGQQRRAILLSDDCEAETILRRAGRSRLVFAAIEPLPLSRDEAERALSTRAFRRFPLPPGDRFPGGVVEFQQLFAVAVDGVTPEGAADPRIARLGNDARLTFEMRWNAYATRRGPLSHLDNAEKLAHLLSAAGDAERLMAIREGSEPVDQQATNVAKASAEALGAAWEIEGAAFNRVAEACEDLSYEPAAIDELIRRFEELGGRAQRVAALLRSYRAA